MTQAHEDRSEPRIAVEVRLSGEALAQRVLSWIEETEGFEIGPAKGQALVTVADHVPDDVLGPVVLLAYESELLSSIRDSRVAALLRPDATLVKLRIAIEAAANGLSISEPRRASANGAGSELTERELEVIAQLALGASNKAIARALGISSHTVKFHVASILEKLGASSRTEAAIQAIRLGLAVV